MTSSFKNIYKNKEAWEKEKSVLGRSD